jgi:hypothetical protein
MTYAPFLASSVAIKSQAVVDMDRQQRRRSEAAKPRAAQTAGEHIPVLVAA